MFTCYPFGRGQVGFRIRPRISFYIKNSYYKSGGCGKVFQYYCKTVLLSLIASEQCDNSLLGPVLIYFRTVKTNGYGTLYLHCLIWLKGALHLPTLRVKI